jgi:DNA polymerase-1
MSWMIYVKFMELLPKEMTFRSLFQLEMLLIPVFVHMESRGIGFSNVVEAENSRIEETLKVLEIKAHKIAGFEFDLNVIEDIQDTLYNKLKIPFISELEKSFKKFGFTPFYILSNFFQSTDQFVLARLASYHPLPAVILQHRKLVTLKT